MLYWIAGPVAPGGGAGKLARNHSTTISVEDDRADARRGKCACAPTGPSSRFDRCGMRYSGSSSSSGRYSPRIMVRLRTKATASALDDAGQVQREQHQAAQIEEADARAAG